MSCSAHRLVLVGGLPETHETKFLIVSSHYGCFLILIQHLKGLHRMHVNSVADVSEADATYIFRIKM
jgi:hypothetical protein